MVIEFENKKSPIEEMKKISEIKELLPQEVKEAVEVGFKDIKETMTFHLAKEETAAGGSSAAKSEAKAEKKPEKKVEQKSETVAGPVKPLSPEEQEQKEREKQQEAEYDKEVQEKLNYLKEKDEQTKGNPTLREVRDNNDFLHFQKKVTDKTSGEIYTLKNIQGKNTINVKVINTGEETIPTKATIDLTVSVKQVYDYISTKDQQHPLKNFFPPLNVADIEKKGTMKPLDPTIQKELNQLNEDIKQHNNKCLAFQTEYNELEARYKKLINSNDDQAVEEFNESARKFNERAEWVIVASQATGEDSLSWRIQILQGKINGESNYDIAKDQIAALNTDTTNALTEILGSTEFKNFRKDGTEITKEKLKTHVKDAFEKYEKYQNPEQSKAYAPILLDQIVDQIFKQKDKIQWKESNNQKVQFRKDENGNDNDIVLDQHGNQITSELMLTRALWLSDPLEQTDTYTAYHQKGGIEYQTHNNKVYRQKLHDSNEYHNNSKWKKVRIEDSKYNKDILKNGAYNDNNRDLVYEAQRAKDQGGGVATITIVTDGEHELAYHNVTNAKITKKLEQEKENVKNRNKAIDDLKANSKIPEVMVENSYYNDYMTEQQDQSIENHWDFSEIKENWWEVKPQHVLAQVLAWIDFEPHKLTSFDKKTIERIYNGEGKTLGLKHYGFEQKKVEEALKKALGEERRDKYSREEEITLTRKEIADLFLWNPDLMQIVGGNGGTLNVALFQVLALRMGGSGETMITPTQQRKNDLIKQLNQKIRHNKTTIYDPDAQQYTKTIKNKKGTTTLILTDWQLQDWIGNVAGDDIEKTIIKMFDLKEPQNLAKTNIKIEDKSQAIDGKFGPGTFLNLPWGKRESALIIPQKKTIKTTTFTITTNLEDKTNNEKPTINKPITLAEVQEIPVKKGTTDLISKASYVMNRRDQLNRGINNVTENFPGYNQEEFVEALVDFNGILWGLLGDTDIPRLADKNLNFWNQASKNILDAETGAIWKEDKEAVWIVRNIITKLDLKENNTKELSDLMNALWEAYSTYPSDKMPSKDQKDERFKYLESRRKMMQDLLPKSLYDSVSEQELSKLGELYEKAVLHPTKDILTPYTERVLLELHALRDPGVTLADVMKRSYSVRFDKSVKSSEADNMINPRYGEGAKDERTFYTRVLPTGYKEIGEEMSPEDRKVAEKFRKKLRSWYSLDAIDDKQYAIEADHFWQVCEKLDNLWKGGEMKQKTKIIKTEDTLSPEIIVEEEVNSEAKEQQVSTMDKLLFLLQDVNFDGSADTEDVRGVHPSNQIRRMFIQAKWLLETTQKLTPTQATDKIVANITKYMKNKGYAEYIHNLPENPTTEQFYTWMKEKFFNTKMVQEVITTAIEDPVYIFTSGTNVMTQQLSNKWEEVQSLSEEDKKNLNEFIDEQMSRWITPEGNLIDAKGKEIKARYGKIDEKGAKIYENVKITQAMKDSWRPIIMSHTVTAMNQCIVDGNLLPYGTTMNWLWNSEANTNNPMETSHIGTNIKNIDLSERLKGLEINLDAAVSWGGIANIGFALGFREGWKLTDAVSIHTDTAIRADLVPNARKISDLSSMIPIVSVPLNIGVGVEIRAPKKNLKAASVKTLLFTWGAHLTFWSGEIQPSFSASIGYQEDKLSGIERQYREITNTITPVITKIFDAINPKADAGKEIEKLQDLLKESFEDTENKVIEDTATFLYHHLKPLKATNAQDRKAVITLTSNRFATQWKNLAVRDLIDEGWELSGVAIGMQFKPISIEMVFSTVISLSATITKYHTPTYEDDPLSKTLQELKLSTWVGSIDTKEKMNESYVKFINTELELRGYKWKLLEVKNGELVIPVRLMQSWDLEVSMHPEFFWRGKTSWTGDLVKEKGTYYNVTDQGGNEELKDWKEPTISLPLNLPYEFFIENETNRNAYHLRIAKPGYEAKELSTNIGDMIASDTQKNKSTPKDNKEGGNSRERLTTKEVIQETETKLTFSSKLLEDLHLLNEEKNQDFLTYLGTIDKTYPSKYQDFLAKKDYQTLQALLSADPKFTEKKEAILEEFQTNEENKSQITDRLIQLFARIDATRISDGLGLKRVLKNHKEEAWGKMFPHAKKLRNSLFEKIKDKDPISRTIDPSIIGFTAYYTPQAGAFKGMKLTALGATTMLEQEEKAVDREGILIERDLKDEPGSIDPQVIQDVMTWLFKENISGNQPGEGALFDAQYGKQRDIIKQQISKYLDGKLPLTAAQISDDLLRKMLLGEEVVIGEDKVQLDVHPVVYLMGECANESIGFRIHKATVKKTVTENITETPATANHYTIRTNIYNAKSIINTQTETKTFEFSGTVDTREAAKKAKERLQSSKSNMNAGDQDTGGGDQDTGGGEQEI